MAIDPHAEAALALHRFGMGPRAGSIAAIASDPRGALLAELERPGAGHVGGGRPHDQRAGLARRVRVSPGACGEHQGCRRAQTPRRFASAWMTRPSRRNCPRRRARRPKRRHRYRSRFSCRKPRRGSTPRSKPSSALSSGWSGSGRTISAFRPTRCCRWRAPTSAKRSGRMCSAALPTCCWRSKAIRRCCSISTTAPRSVRNSVAGINRSRGLNENLAREILELHTLGVRRRLHAGRHHPVRPCPHRLDHHSGGRRSRARRRIHLHQAHARAGPAAGARARPTRRRRRAGPRACSPISRGIRRPRSMSRPSSRAISSPTCRRRRWSRRSRKTFRDTDGDLKAVATALVTAPESWAAERSKLKRPSEWIMSIRRATGSRGAPIRVVRAQAHARRAAVAAAGAERIFRRGGGLGRRPGAPARYRQRLCAARGGPRRSARRCSRPRWPAGVGGDAAGRRAGREPPAGAGAAA